MYAIMVGIRKRREYLKQIINWYLYDDLKKIINNKNVECEYVPDRNLIFEDQYGKHIIDLENNTYEKISSDSKMTIDFTKQTCRFDLNEAKNLVFDIKCSLKKQNNRIVIEYTFGEENKKLEIIMKE